MPPGTASRRPEPSTTTRQAKIRDGDDDGGGGGDGYAVHGLMVVVTGYKRSGTSLMMGLLRELGVPLHYTPAFETELRSFHGGGNPFYYEHASFTGSACAAEHFDGAVKIFSPMLQHNLPVDRKRVRVLWMRRDPAAMERSIRRYKLPGTTYAGPGGHSSSTLEDDLAAIANLEVEFREAERTIPHLLPVEFDKLIATPGDVMRTVAAFLSVPFTGAMAEAFKTLIRGREHHQSRKYNQHQNHHHAPPLSVTVPAAQR